MQLFTQNLYGSKSKSNKIDGWNKSWQSNPHKKTKTAEFAFCGSPECFHLETTFTPGEPP
jgi:hypothetical protein